MKKIFVFVVFLALGVITIPWLHQAGASDQKIDVYENQKFIKSVVFVVDWDEYYIDGKVPGIKMDAKPFIENERIYVPVRYLGNALGVSDNNIVWDNSAQKATLKRAADVLEMTVGVTEVRVNGRAETIDVSPVLKSDPSWRTYLPARFVAEGLGYQLEWDPNSRIVMCWPKDQPKPDVTAVKQYVEQAKQGQPAQPGEMVNGYVVPANTDLYVSPVDKYGDPEGYIVFSINIKKGNLQQQYADAESILSQTLDADTTAKAIEFAKQAHVRDNDNCLPPITTFNASNGMAVRVAGGDITVQFDVWQTKK